MKQVIISTALVFGIGYGSTAMIASYGKNLRQESKDLQASVTNYEAVLTQLQSTEATTNQLSKEGGSTFGYQLAVSERSTLPARVERAILDVGGATLSNRNYDDQSRAVLRVSSQSPANLLKVLAKLETGFPELRLRTATWTGSKDGVIVLDAIFDIWPIPTPDAKRLNNRPINNRK